MDIEWQKLVGKVLAHWREGKSGSEIANTLGRTRGSIMGIVHRARLDGAPGLVRIGEKNKIRTPPTIKNRRILRQIKLGTMSMPIIPSYAFPPDEIVPEKHSEPGVTLMELKLASCRYIIKEGDVYTALYCGEGKQRGSYCATHAALCYTPLYKGGVTRKKKRTAFILRSFN
jgi:hypothetical protein